LPQKESDSRDTLSESALEKELVLAVKKAHGLILKLNPLWYIGIPDRLILLPKAKIFFVELKRYGEKPRRNQVRWLTLLQRLGFPALTVAGKVELKTFIREHINGFEDLP